MQKSSLGKDEYSAVEGPPTRDRKPSQQTGFAPLEPVLRHVTANQRQLSERNLANCSARHQEPGAGACRGHSEVFLESMGDYFSVACMTSFEFALTRDECLYTIDMSSMVASLWRMALSPHIIIACARHHCLVLKLKAIHCLLYNLRLC